MIHINLEDNLPSAEWLAQADNVTAQLIEAADWTQRKQIIDDNQHLWTELKIHLASIRNRKCWYTESINDGAHCHVDHFRPKLRALDEKGDDHGGYWWLAFDWMNYRYAGPVSNVRKRDYFPVLSNKANNYGDNLNLEDTLLLDPVVIGDPAKLAYDVEGKVVPRSQDTSGRDYRKAIYSIERYNLNTEGLKEGRRQKQLAVSKLIAHSQRLIVLQAVKYDKTRENEIMDIWRELKKMAHPDCEYSAAVKYCLKSSGFDWAVDIAIAA